jgi:hypothetical protein
MLIRETEIIGKWHSVCKGVNNEVAAPFPSLEAILVPKDGRDCGRTTGRPNRI